MSELIFPFINLGILITLLGFIAGAAQAFVRDRHENLRDELQRVRDLFDQREDQVRRVLV